MLDKSVKWAITLGVIVLIGVGGALKFFEKIDNGFVGVRYSPTGGIRDEVLNQGIKFVGIDQVIQYPIRLQTIQAEGVAVSTSDGKKTAVNIKYDYKVDPTAASQMYKEFGNITNEDIEEGWLKSKLQKEAREVYSKYSLLNVLAGESTEVEAALLENFANSVEDKGFIIEDVTVGIPEVDAETQKSIDSIIRAGQENEKAKLDSETRKTQADSDAEIKKTQADAKAYEVTTNAEARAEANKKISDSITENLILYEEVQARKSHGWVTVKGADAIVVDE